MVTGISSLGDWGMLSGNCYMVSYVDCYIVSGGDWCILLSCDHLMVSYGDWYVVSPIA